MNDDTLLTGYNVHTESDRRAMLDAIGVSSIQELFACIDPDIRLTRDLNLPPPLTEWELARHMRQKADQNGHTLNHDAYLGAGIYQHHIPELVRSLSQRGEFLTAYTPYQPEMSQGLLRVLYDFQQLVGRLLGLPSVNCSVYDGATALAESAWMARRIKQQDRLITASTLWPEHEQVLQTYMKGRQVALASVPADPHTGCMDLGALEEALEAKPVSAVLVQSPNRFGVLEPVRKIADLCHAKGALLIVSGYPMLHGVVQSPGEEGADIVCCEAQSLGIELNAGGPHLGVIATREEHVEHLPGRIVGICRDLKGEEAFALVKESREQHVSRDQATSHICSNQAFLALRATVYLATLGERGFRKLAALNASKAHYLEAQLTRIEGVRRAVSGPFFNEFLLQLPCPSPVLLDKLRAHQIFAGVDASHWGPKPGNLLLIAVTELKSKSDLDRYVRLFREAVQASNPKQEAKIA